MEPLNSSQKNIILRTARVVGTMSSGINLCGLI